MCYWWASLINFSFCTLNMYVYIIYDATFLYVQNIRRKWINVCLYVHNFIYTTERKCVISLYNTSRIQNRYYPTTNQSPINRQSPDNQLYICWAKPAEYILWGVVWDLWWPIGLSVLTTSSPTRQLPHCIRILSTSLPHNGYNHPLVILMKSWLNKSRSPTQ